MSEQKEVVKKEVHRCNQCRWYDHSTQRDFHRDGIRKGLVEVRAICRSPTSKARNHLVKNDSDRECFEEGKYVTPKEEPRPEVPESVKIGDIIKWKNPKTEQLETYRVVKVGRSGKRLMPIKEKKEQKKQHTKTKKEQNSKKNKMTVSQNGNTATFEKKGRKTVLVKNQQ